jgi:tripartite-type tricarboxylate transporter receptor subunit TctC
MNWKPKILMALLTSLAMLAIHHAQAAAPQDNSRPITLIVPFGVGGSTDITARLLADKLRPILGQSVIVENRAGAGGNIGAMAVARAAPDGQTILMATSTHVTNPSLYKSLQYDVMKDLSPVAQVAFIPNMLVVNNDLPVKTLSDFVNYVKENKGPVNYGSSGNGSSQHLAGAMFNNMAGGKMVHVPYKGGGAATLDLLTGQIQAYFAPLAEVVGHIEGGKVKAMGVTTKERSKRFPNVQTINEVLPGFELALWNGILTTANSPPEQIARLSAAINKVLQDPDMQKRLAEQGSVPSHKGPAEFKTFMEAELKKWAQLVKISGANVE